MIPKSGNRFSEKIMLKQKSMIPKSGNRFSEKIMLKKLGRGRRDPHRREGDFHQRALIRCALDEKCRAIGFGQRLGQRQAESGAAEREARRRRDLPERLERGGDVALRSCRCRCRARAATTRRRSSIAVETMTWPPATGEFDRVGQQVEHDLAHRARVGDDLRQLRRERRADDDALAAGLRLHASRRIAGSSSLRSTAREVELELAGLDLGEIEQVVDAAR